MNNFCRCLKLSLMEKFRTEINIFVSKKKKLFHMSFLNILISHESFNDFVSFMRSYWHARKYFYSGYFFIYPRLNQSLK